MYWSLLRAGRTVLMRASVSSLVSGRKRLERISAPVTPTAPDWVRARMVSTEKGLTRMVSLLSTRTSCSGV